MKVWVVLFGFLQMGAWMVGCEGRQWEQETPNVSSRRRRRCTTTTDRLCDTTTTLDTPTSTTIGGSISTNRWRCGGGLDEQSSTTATTTNKDTPPLIQNSTTTISPASSSSSSSSHSPTKSFAATATVWKNGWTNFGPRGMYKVHLHYLPLLWDVTRTSALLLAPIVVLFFLGASFPTSSTTQKIIPVLQTTLIHLETYASWIPQQLLRLVLLLEPPISSKGVSSPILAMLLRPLIDAILFRSLIQYLWKQSAKVWTTMTFSKTTQRSTTTTSTTQTKKGEEDSMAWSLVSSILYGCAHMGQLITPSTAVFQQAVKEATQGSGDLVFLGFMTLHRDHWNARVVEYLIQTQPLLQTVGRGVVHAVVSWGLLCPLHQIYGLVSSLGAHYAWQVLTWRHVDTQILVRVLARIFCMPGSSSSSSSKDGTSTKSKTMRSNPAGYYSGGATATSQSTSGSGGATTTTSTTSTTSDSVVDTTASPESSLMEIPNRDSANAGALLLFQDDLTLLEDDYLDPYSFRHGTVSEILEKRGRTDAVESTTT